MADYRERADYWATKYGVDPAVFAKLINTESGWNPNAVSPTGARGLTQVLSSTARDPGFGVAPLTDFSDTDDQLRFGAEYLAAMQQRYGGDTSKALLAYNQGAGVADDWSGDRSDMSGLPSEGRNYVNTIMGGGDPGTGIGPGIAYSTGEIAPPPPKVYEPDKLDDLYAKVQASGMGQTLGLKQEGFRKGSQGRKFATGFMAALGNLA